MSRKIKMFISAFMTLAVMILIFFFTSQNGEKSSEVSSNVTRTVAETVFPEFRDSTKQAQEIILDGLHGLIRKLAHFAIFGLLGASVFTTCRYILISYRRKLLLSVLFCFCYAIVDEMRQILVPGRDGRITDVFIDTCGSVCGIFAVMLVFALSAVIRVSAKNDEEKAQLSEFTALMVGYKK